MKWRQGWGGDEGGMEMMVSMGTPTQGRWGQMWGRWLCTLVLPRPGRASSLPAEWAVQAAVAGTAPQAAGTEVVVAVKQAGVLVGLMAQQADQRVAVGLLQLRAALHQGEDATRHLWGREQPLCVLLHPLCLGGPAAPLHVSAVAAVERTNPAPLGPTSSCLFLGYELHGTRLPQMCSFPLAPQAAHPQAGVSPEKEHPLQLSVPQGGWGR